MSRRFLLAAGTTATVPPPGTGGPTGDAALFQAAIDEVAPTGGTVLFSGSYTVTSPITLPNGVWLVGDGWKGSQIKLADGANCHVVQTTPDAPVRYAGVANFYIDGNRANNTSGDGIHFDNPKPDYTNGECSVNIIEDMLVEYAPRDAFHLGAGQVESRIFNGYAFSPGRHGIYADGSDYWITDCTVGESGGDGVVLLGIGARMSGTKSWWSGRQVPPRTNGNPGSGNGGAVGFRINVENPQIVNCEAQDSTGPGAAVSGQAGKIQLHIDANNGAGMNPASAYMLDVGYATRMHVDVNIGTGTGRPLTQYVLNIGGQATGNRIDLWSGCENRTIYRPGSAAVGTNTVNATGSFA